MIGVCALLLAAATAITPLPGENGHHAAVTCAPFPDRMSAFVWRNWQVVPVARMAEVVGAQVSDLERIAADLSLPVPQPEVSPLWRRRGYITLVRRNWHLLPYSQLLNVLDMSREEFAFSLQNDDFLWVKLGYEKPDVGGALVYREAEQMALAPRRRALAADLRRLSVDPSEFCEPRFGFLKDFSAFDIGAGRIAKASSCFETIGLTSYFAEYGDPLMSPEVPTYPEELLKVMSARGVNMIFLTAVLQQLVTDPAYPEFGVGSERRIAALNTLIKRAGKFGIKVMLYFNEPRAQPDAFFKARPEREAIRGAKGFQGYSICLKTPEGERWFRESIRQLFQKAPGLWGLAVTTASENQTNCGSHNQQGTCPHCCKFPQRQLLADTIRLIVESSVEIQPDAKTVVSTWAWPSNEVSWILRQLPKTGVGVSATSEGGLPIERGGVKSVVGEYSISAGHASDRSRARWHQAQSAGLAAYATVVSGCTWELSAIPAIPALDLIARHAFDLKKAGVNGVTLCWTCGSYPSANHLLFSEMTADDQSPDEVLDRVAERMYGHAAVPAVRKAWSAFSTGFAEYPFHIGVVYNSPVQMGPANPLYSRPTGWKASMVGFPYDDLASWRSIYPAPVWIAQMDKVADGFARGCELWERAIPLMPVTAAGIARRDLLTYQAAMLHFRSVADQARFVLARDAGDCATMRQIAIRERETAREMLARIRADCRIGYECSNHYYYLPCDLIEILLCDQLTKGEL